MQTAMYQRKLLQVAVQLLRPGGYLVYSTCTINPGAHKTCAMVFMSAEIDTCLSWSHAGITMSWQWVLF